MVVEKGAVKVAEVKAVLNLTDFELKKILDFLLKLDLVKLDDSTQYLSAGSGVKGLFEGKERKAEQVADDR